MRRIRTNYEKQETKRLTDLVISMLNDCKARTADLIGGAALDKYNDIQFILDSAICEIEEVYANVQSL